MNSIPYYFAPIIERAEKGFSKQDITALNQRWRTGQETDPIFMKSLGLDFRACISEFLYSREIGSRLKTQVVKWFRSAACEVSDKWSLEWGAQSFEELSVAATVDIVTREGLRFDELLPELVIDLQGMVIDEFNRFDASTAQYEDALGYKSILVSLSHNWLVAPLSRRRGEALPYRFIDRDEFGMRHPLINPTTQEKIRDMIYHATDNPSRGIDFRLLLHEDLVVFAAALEEDEVGLLNRLNSYPAELRVTKEKGLLSPMQSRNYDAVIGQLRPNEETGYWYDFVGANERHSLARSALNLPVVNLFGDLRSSESRAVAAEQAAQEAQDWLTDLAAQHD